MDYFHVLRVKLKHDFWNIQIEFVHRRLQAKYCLINNRFETRKWEINKLKDCLLKTEDCYGALGAIKCS